MPQAPISNIDDLWKRVEELVNSLRAASSESDADRLLHAMTISAHPGEVWPETRSALRDLLRRQPPGLDADSASACADYLARLALALVLRGKSGVVRFQAGAAVVATGPWMPLSMEGSSERLTATRSQIKPCGARLSGRFCYTLAGK